MLHFWWESVSYFRNWSQLHRHDHSGSRNHWELPIDLCSVQGWIWQQILQSLNNACICWHQVVIISFWVQVEWFLFSYLSMKEVTSVIRCFDLYYPGENLMNLYYLMRPYILHPLYKIIQLTTVLITMILRFRFLSSFSITIVEVS